METESSIQNWQKLRRFTQHDWNIHDVHKFVKFAITEKFLQP